MAERLSPYHELKVLHPYHLVRVEQLLEGKIPPPSNVEIDLSDHGCNQACIYCSFGSSYRRKLRLIDKDLLLPFLSDVYDAGTYAFELVGGGEPTNHPEINDIINRIANFAKSGAERPHIGLITNGVLLPRVFKAAQDGLLDWVRVSLDSANPGLYHLLHGVDPGSNHFYKVVDHLKQLTDLMDPANIGIGYLVVPPYNHTETAILAGAELAVDLGVGHIGYRPAQLSKDQRIDTDMWIEAARAIVKARTIYGNVVKGGQGGSWDYVTGKLSHPTGPCITRPLVMVIKADGNLASCFLFRNETRDRPHLGHLSKGFRQVWFSENHQRQWKRVERGNCPSPCKSFRADAAVQRLVRGESPIVDSAGLTHPYFI